MLLMDRREMKRRMKSALGSLLLSYGDEWSTVPNFWTTLEDAVFRASHRPPTKAERMRFNAVRIRLMWELKGKP